MASNTVVARSMAVLGATFPRDVTPELVAIYAGALRDVDDATLAFAVDRAVATLRFFPVPAELRELAGANRAPFVDSEAILSRIWGMADYHPARGTTPPRVEAVRAAFGDAVGDAYGLAGGGSRLYSGNETTASIARREFERELAAAVKVHGVPAEPQLALQSGSSGSSGSIVFDEAPRLRAGFKRLSTATSLAALGVARE